MILKAVLMAIFMWVIKHDEMEKEENENRYYGN